MRFRFKASPEQRALLGARLRRLQSPAAALEILASTIPSDFKPVSVTSIVQQRHSNRFVLKVQLRSGAGELRAYALKVYSDDFGGRVWEHAQALGTYQDASHDGVCLPTRYVPEEHALVFPWVGGEFLSDIVDHRKPELLQRAARLAAELHRLPLVPEEATTAEMIVDETRARCARLRRRWRETGRMIEQLLAGLQDALGAVDPADPALVHGDLAAGQFLWTGDRLVLLDLDIFGYTDPAYDAGHFLAQLERRCVLDSTVSIHARQWRTCFRDTYLAAMRAAMRPVSPRNISFYRGLTLIRKIYTLCRTQPTQWPRLVPSLAVRAQAALEEATSPEPVA